MALGGQSFMSAGVFFYILTCFPHRRVCGSTYISIKSSNFLSFFSESYLSGTLFNLWPIHWKDEDQLCVTVNLIDGRGLCVGSGIDETILLCIPWWGYRRIGDVLKAIRGLALRPGVLEGLTQGWLKKHKYWPDSAIGDRVTIRKSTQPLARKVGLGSR